MRPSQVLGALGRYPTLRFFFPPPRAWEEGWRGRGPAGRGTLQAFLLPDIQVPI